MNKAIFPALLLFLSASAFAADTGAVIGGAAGAAAGAAIGHNANGRNGAVLGAAIGAAAGVMLGSSNQAQGQVAPVQAQPVRPVRDDARQDDGEDDGHYRHRSEDQEGD